MASIGPPWTHDGLSRTIEGHTWHLVSFVCMVYRVLNQYILFGIVLDHIKIAPKNYKNPHRNAKFPRVVVVVVVVVVGLPSFRSRFAGKCGR